MVRKGATRKLRIMVADSHEVVRLGISFILRRCPDLEVVAEAAACAEVLEKAEESAPDIIIMDYRLNDGCSVEICRLIGEKLPGTRVVMMVSASDEEGIFAAISAGAAGILPKQIRSDELAMAVRAVSEGKTMLDPSITTKVIERLKNNAPQPERKDLLLNPQERRILALIAEGKTNKEIAGILMLSNNTVKNYVSGILSKLNFSNRAEAAAYAVRNNMLKHFRAAGEQ